MYAFGAIKGHKTNYGDFYESVYQCQAGTEMKSQVEKKMCYWWGFHVKVYCVVLIFFPAHNFPF